MAIDPEIFIHESDKAALNTLKSIPGFSQVLKAFMKIWNERQYRILNMSTYLNVNDEQMSEYYDMLKPICKKLGIKVPELYISLDPRPNAYTSGDTDPFIVVTSGLINAFPKELLPVVLAHECGHIVCHHVLYKTMGKMILSGAAEIIGFRSLLTAPIQTAFYYWMRCSEYSADRVAAVCCGDSDIVTEMCMRLAGYDKNIPFEANKEAFMQQAVEYRKMIKSSAFNRSMEFMMFNRMSHPMNAVRAYECRKWSKTDTFRYAVEFVDEESRDVVSHTHVPMTKSAKDFMFKDRREAADMLHKMGFTNIVMERRTETSKHIKEGRVIGVTVAGSKDFSVGDWFSGDDRAVIYYYQPPTYEEISAEHPDELVVPAGSISYFGRNYKDVEAELRAAGFVEFEITRQPDIKMGIFSSEGDIAKIAINGAEKFDKGDVFGKDAVVSIRYHAYEEPRK
ncbi:MAG: M48 family metallopeptidase [Ruminococcus sp.]|nr:M48 family metallopeptidase [Ruminococcus sp.]